MKSPDIDNSSMAGKRSLISVCYVFAVGGLLFNLQPLLLGALAASHELSDSQLGLTSSTALLSSCILVIAGFYWVPRISWRSAMGTGVALSAIASAALPLANNFTNVLLATGGIGAGMAICFAPALVALGTAPNPARAFGLGMAAQVLLAGIGIFILPAQLLPAFGLSGFSTFMVLAVIPGLLMLHWVPDLKDRRMSDRDMTPRPSSNLTGWLALAGSMEFLDTHTTTTHQQSRPVGPPTRACSRCLDVWGG
jgi:MFS family permease